MTVAVRSHRRWRCSYCGREFGDTELGVDHFEQTHLGPDQFHDGRLPYEPEPPQLRD